MGLTNKATTDHWVIISYSLRYVYVMFFLALYVLILCSNCIIICLIWIHRNLHEPMYIFIAALSLNSLFFSTAIYPKLVVAVLSNQQSVSYSGCLVQVFFFYSLGSSDILLLLAMAYDRYVSICRPLQYASTMGTTCVSICLASAWFVPVCLMSVTVVVQSKQKICSVTLTGIICNATMMNIHCTLPKFLAMWTLFTLSVMAVIPVLFIFFTYFKIFMVAYHSQGEVWKKAVDTCLPHLIVLLATFSLMTFDIIIGLLESVLPKNVRLILTLQTLVYNPLLNPIIYGLKMTEIRKHIKRLRLLLLIFTSCWVSF
uniref:Olfactory receptor n=1 Tax=Hippocampus comes TaxID=109280 RepID=A0A3Q2YYZ3_HIPCM